MNLIVLLSMVLGALVLGTAFAFQTTTRTNSIRAHTRQRRIQTMPSIESRSRPTGTTRSPFLLLFNQDQPDIELDTFDFSSRKGWDDFYRQLELGPKLEASDQNRNTNSTFEFEWHASIPHSSITSEIKAGSRVLLVGTGNSKLPKQLYDAHGGATHVSCMDYSKPCIEMLENLHARDCPHMEFFCGDATQLSRVVKGDVYDYVVDKGLMDAMMCDEGWNGAVDKYLEQVARVLRSGGDNNSGGDGVSKGKLILVSYKLNSSMREYLLCAGDTLGIRWQLDIKDKSNDRVSFSMGQLI